MGISILEWLGYIASAIVAISLATTSIVKFRWINFIGAATFSIYGFLIGALPVGFLNGLITIIDLYFLYIIYNKKEIFEILEIESGNEYLKRFLKFYAKDIHKIFPDFTYEDQKNNIAFFILRNTAVTGLFLANRNEDNLLKVELDYVIPEYRDFKNGKYIYHRLKNKFIKQGFNKVECKTKNKQHSKYLKRIGFSEDTDGNYYKILHN
ncbi:MAG: hypothetical protein MI739_14795 [Bacteroidales bacterium]|nr:hypothetical protein [Bacteroidales bacterium]